MRTWFVLAGLLAVASVSSAQNVQVLPAQDLPVQVQVQPAVQARIIVQPGKADIAGPALYMPNRLSAVDAVFVGRVIAIEPMDVQASPAAGQAKVAYRVAVVQVSEAIHGVKKGTETVRVAFVAQANAVPGNPGVGIQILPVQPGGGGFGGRRPFYPGNVAMTLEMGQDGLFNVNKHYQENFFMSPMINQFVNRQNNPGFDDQVKNAKQLAKIMGDPVAALKADDKNDRYLAAAFLIAKYRNPANPTGAPMKEEQVSAEESKLILQALAGGDWTPGRFNAGIPNPYELFNQLNINQKDGYTPANIQNQQQLGQAMQKWIDENTGKYQIRRMVVDPNAKAGPGVNPPPLPVPPGIRGGLQPLPAPAGQVPEINRGIPQALPPARDK